MLLLQSYIMYPIIDNRRKIFFFSKQFSYSMRVSFVFTQMLTFTKTQFKLPKVRNSFLIVFNPQGIALFLKTRTLYHGKHIYKDVIHWKNIFLYNGSCLEIFCWKGVLSISQNSSKNTCIGVYYFTKVTE